MPACASLVTSTTPVGSSGEGTLSPRSRRDRRTRTTRKSTVSASPRAMFRDLPAALGRHAGGHHQRPADHPVPHSHVQVGGVDEDVGEPGAVQAAGQELVHALVDARRGSARPSSARCRTRCPGPARGRQALRVETPSIHAEQITAHLGLVHPPARVEQGGEERPRAKLGDGELDLACGGGHRLEALAVAAVGALRRALIALRADHGGGPEPRPDPATRPGGRRRKTPV